MAGSRHLVDPQLLPLLDVLPKLELDAAALPAMRGRPARFTVRPEDIERTDLTLVRIPGPEGAPEVEVRFYRPKGLEGAAPCILHIHGGGYIAGSSADKVAAKVMKPAPVMPEAPFEVSMATPMMIS